MYIRLSACVHVVRSVFNSIFLCMYVCMLIFLKHPSTNSESNRSWRLRPRSSRPYGMYTRRGRMPD